MPESSFREAFLHYVWQYQYFTKQELITTGGDNLQVLSTGFYNTNAGPDFLNSRLIINGLEWHGSVEIHYRSSDWHKHKHTNNAAYNNVVLHVVWENDIPIARADGSLLPALELRNRISPQVIQNYTNLVSVDTELLCKRFLPDVDPLFPQLMLEKCMVERLENKSKLVHILLSESGKDWEQTAYKWLGKCFGFKINGEAFERLCTLLPYQLLRKYLHNPIQTQALLFGISGLLSEATITDHYISELQKEFHYLKNKHQLEHVMSVAEWKFMRLRPANFPTLRLAQFSAFLQSCSSISDLFLQQHQLKQINQNLQASPHTFWSTHYHFNKTNTSQHPGKMGTESSDNLIMNAILPLRFAYALHYDQTELKENALELLRQLKAEKNTITRYFTQAGFTLPTAFETQASIQLFHQYCETKKCLSCLIGHQIVQPAASVHATGS